MNASHLDEFESWLSLGALGGDDVDGVAVDEAVAEEADPVALAQPQRHARQHRRRHLRHLVVQPEPIPNLLGEFVHFLGCRFPVNTADFWLCLRKFWSEADRGRLPGQRREFKTHRKSTAQRGDS